MALCFFLDDEAARLTKKGQIDPFPSTTPSLYLWRLPDPNVRLQRFRAALCLATAGRPGFPKKGRSIRFRQQPDPFPSTTPPFSVNNYPFLPLVAPGP